MPDTSFKIYFGERAATAEELNRIEEIVVEQRMDAIWEARMKFYLCLDDKGNWRHLAGEFTEPFSKVRVELKVGDKPWEPLIDGPVAAFENDLDSQPGRSVVTVVVRDHSVFLNRDDQSENHEGKTDQEVARAIFNRHTDVLDGSPEIQAPENDEPRDAFQRDNDLVFLRKLARAHKNYHAYVLPTETKGKSKGYFRPNPATASTDHPALVLLGSGRNLASVSITEDAESQEKTRARTIRITDQQIITSESSARDEVLMRDLPAVPEDVSAIRHAPPQEIDREDPAAAAQAQNARRALAFKLTGKVVPCYPAVLKPYIKVAVQAGDSPYSGDWLIQKVTHRISPSVYTQEFEALSDSKSTPKSGAAVPTGGAGLSLSFSASLSVF